MTTKEKIIRKLKKLPENKLKDIYVIINKHKSKKKPVRRIPALRLGKKLDKANIRKIAYE